MKSAYLISLFAVALAGCSSTSTTIVKVPPRMLLDRNQTIGIVRFDVESARAEDHNVTAKFIEAIQHAQPGVPIVELGSSSEVLNGVGKSQLNGEALQAIGKKFNVDAVIVGSVQLKESQPKVNVNLAQGIKLSSVQAQVRLDGRLDARIVTTARGASVWTGSSARWINLADVSGSGLGVGSFNLPDRDRQYEKLISDMVNDASSDFCPTWEKQLVTR
jgi:hypothetical protein